MNQNINFDIQQWAKEVEAQIAPAVQRIEQIVEQNQWKVLEAFQKHRVSDFHFQDSTGYGYNDIGRETLDAVYADVFGAEAAIVRPHFVSGTHAIATALFGVLRPGERMLSVTGTPYDTLCNVIGVNGGGSGTLADWKIGYDEVSLLPDGSVDWEGVERALKPETKVAAIQRSRGYSTRRSFSVDEIAEMVRRLKQLRPDLVIFVDNCYGEFAETKEPTDVGADLIAGSLIKNPGGGIVVTGGYIAGKKEWVELASHRLTAPGLGNELGAMLGTTRSIFQGLFLAPLIVGQALRGSVFAAAMFEKAGLKTDPLWNDPRTDLIQAVHFGDESALIDFVRSIQAASAIDAHVVPEPSEMPGYDHPVIMAAGTFMQGGSLELTADAPIRPPYTAFMQGGLTYAHVKYAVMKAMERYVSRMNPQF
jgi:cystathionine beta-lyase family protein involved in aluminum resistance